MNYSLATASSIIHLMKGVVYYDRQPQIWQQLLKEQTSIRDYLAVIGLQLIIDEAEGYAFLKQYVTTEEEAENTLPRLISRRPLSYPVSLLLVLLRKKLQEQDASGSDTRVILEREQIIQLMSVFLPEKNNEIKIIEQIDSCINKLIDLGFLRSLSTDQTRFEVRRIVKAFIDANFIADFNVKLQEYQIHEQTITVRNAT